VPGSDRSYVMAVFSVSERRFSHRKVTKVDPCASSSHISFLKSVYVAV
jgi:hypothetical protein